MISHYMICQRCQQMNPVDYVEPSVEQTTPANCFCSVCGSHDLIVEGADDNDSIPVTSVPALRNVECLSPGFSGVFESKDMKTKLLALAALGTAAMGNVYAAVPADVTTALGDMKADGLVIAGVVLVATIAVFAFKFMRKGL